MDSRAERAAENEALFRRINERVEALSERFETLTLICECADPACLERLADVSVAEYEAVRHHPDRFFVRRGHERPELETVVDERADYVVVAKRGDAGEVARATDPRSD